MSISHEEFQFNAKVLGYDIANEDNTYHAEVLCEYFNLYFNDNQLHPVPDEMIVIVKNNYNFTFSVAQKFISFPKDKLEVHGDFTMSNNITKVLPVQLICNGFFHAKNCVFESLPKKCTFLNHVVLNRSAIKVLPDDLTIDGSLNLSNCKNIQELPQNLKIQGILFIDGTNIKDIPSSTSCDNIIKD